MALLTIIKYTEVAVDDAELSVGAVRQGRETGHQAFLREIKAITKGGKRKIFKRKQHNES